MPLVIHAILVDAITISIIYNHLPCIITPNLVKNHVYLKFDTKLQMLFDPLALILKFLPTFLVIITYIFTQMGSKNAILGLFCPIWTKPDFSRKIGLRQFLLFMGP